MDSELLSSFAFTSFIVAVSGTGILLLYTIGLRVGHIIHDKHMEYIRTNWWPTIGRAAIEGASPSSRALRKLQRGRRSKVLHEWCRFRALVRGDSSQALTALAGQLRLVQVARRLLVSPRVSNKLLALRALGFLQDRDSWNRISNLLGHSNLTIAVTAAEALVNIDARKGIEELMPLIAHRSAWPRTRIGQILNAAGPEAVTRPYCSAIHDASVSEAIQLLRYFEAALVSDVDSAVAEMLLRRTDPGLISAALKAVRGHLPTTLIKRFVRHHTWYVRMQTANLLGRLGRREDYPRLEPLLSDSEWWVRYRAAQALVNLPYLDLSSLLDLQRRQQDPYARDILGQAIAEAGLA